MIGADLGRAALLATVPVCYALHVLAMTQLYLVTFGAGTLSILFNVSDATLFVSIVAPERYLDGQSLIYGSRALSFMGGPSIGGLLVQVFTAPGRCGSPPSAGPARRCSCCPRRCPGSRCRIGEIPGRREPSTLRRRAWDVRARRRRPRPGVR